MSRTNEVQKQEDIEFVRRALIVTPRATIRAVKDTILKETNRDMSLNYVNSLVNLVRSNRQVKYNEAKVHDRVAEMEENFTILREEMYAIVNDPRATNKDRINAAKQIAIMDKDLLQAQLDTGIFDRKLGEINVNHRLDPEIAIPMLNAFKNFGFIKSVDIIEIKPNEEHEQPSDNGNTSLAPPRSAKRSRNAKKNGE